MRKALVMLLALTMVMSTFAMMPLSAFAADGEIAIGTVAADYKPEGTAVKSATEFEAMTADGKYYLDADITVSKTYMASFKGVFDGNGHTITTTVPLFDKLNGTVKNLIVDGTVVDDVPYTSGDYATGVVAHLAANEGNAVLENICNKASIESKYKGAAGIVGMSNSDSATHTITIINCENRGSVKANFYYDDAHKSSGGILGRSLGKNVQDPVQTVLKNCYNYGYIQAVGHVGGIAGMVACAHVQFLDCVNNGAVVGLDGYWGSDNTNHNTTGGIVGRLGQSGSDAAKAIYLLENCVNNGDVSYQATRYPIVGGIAGNVGTGVSFTFKNCVNNGDVTSDANSSSGTVSIGGMFGVGRAVTMKNDAKMVLEGCVNNGTIALADGAQASDAKLGGMIGNSNHKVELVLEGCVNNGKVGVWADATSSKVYAGGMIGQKDAADALGVKYINCKNTGVINADPNPAKANSNTRAGGIVGIDHTNTAEGVIFLGCINSGNVVANNYAGGICGQTAKAVTYTSCGNAGNVTSTWDFVGGLTARMNVPGDVTYCFNTGIITAERKNTVAGLVAFMNSQPSSNKNATNALCKFEYNYVAGKIVSGVAATPAITGSVSKNDATKRDIYTFKHDGKDYYFMYPYSGTHTFNGTTVTNPTISKWPVVKDGDTLNKATSKQDWYLFKGNDGRMYGVRPAVNNGVTIKIDPSTNDYVYVNGVKNYTFLADITVYDEKPQGFAICYSQEWQVECDLSKNIIAEGTALIAYACSYTNTLMPGSNAIPVGKTYTAEQFASGEVAAKLNEMAGEQVFFQNLDPELFITDAFPTTDSAHAKVVEIGGKYSNQMFDAENDSGSPATGDATVYVVVALAVSTISLAAIAVARKIKEN